MKEDAEVGERVASWGEMDVSIHQRAPFPDRRTCHRAGGFPRPPTIYLTAGGELMAPARLFFFFFWWICLCRSLPARPPSGGVLKQTCPLTRLPSSTSWLEENEKNAVKLKKKKRKKKPRTQFSEAWKVISDRTCQGFMRDLLRVMKKKGENGEISFTKTKQRLQKNAIRSFPALPYKSIYTKVAEQRGFAGHN